MSSAIMKRMLGFFCSCAYPGKAAAARAPSAIAPSFKRRGIFMHSSSIRTDQLNLELHRDARVTGDRVDLERNLAEIARRKDFVKVANSRACRLGEGENSNRARLFRVPMFRPGISRGARFEPYVAARLPVQSRRRYHELTSGLSRCCPPVRSRS